MMGERSGGLRSGALIDIDGAAHSVGSVLGEGGQGRVWDLRDRTETPVSALKWYHSRQATSERRRHVRWLIASGSPSPSFAWPQRIVDVADHSGFGVLMPLISANARPLSQVTGLTMPDAVAITRRLAVAVSELHLHGIAHRDLSFANVLVDRAAHAVHIIDNDGAGTAQHPDFGVRGTRSTTLPEVLERHRPADMAADRYSLSVLARSLLAAHRDRLDAVVPLFERTDLACPEPLEWVLALDRDSQLPPDQSSGGSVSAQQA